MQVDMVDIKVRPDLDLTNGKVQRDLLNKISTGYYAAIILSPLCSTFTRTTFSNRKGPRPVRSYVHLRGLLRLTWTEGKKANWGNVMTDFSFQVCKLVQNTDAMVFFDNPEDLGAVQSGPYQGQRPASMWQWPTFQELLQDPDYVTCAFYQSDFGTDYLKPTRLLLKSVDAETEVMFKGLPQFDDQGFYQGPLQRRQTEVRLIGQQAGKFCTSGTEQWPSSFCKWVATIEQSSEVEQQGYPIAQLEGWKIPEDVRYPASHACFMMVAASLHRADGTLRSAYGMTIISGGS